MSPRRLQSLIASITSATGFTVGCISSSSARPGRKRVDAGIVPDVGAVAATAAKLDIVDVRRGADLEHEHQLVLRPIERSHAAVVLVPDAEVLQLRVTPLAAAEQFADMPPVHADEVNGAILADCGHVLEGGA